MLDPAETLSPRLPFERRNVLSAAVDIASPDEIAALLIDCAQRHAGRSVVGISAPYASAMKRDKKMREAFLAADLLVPDGKGFVWGARSLGVPCGDRIAIPDLCERLLEEGNARGWKVFLYGSTTELNARALENLRARFPNLHAEGQNGYGQGEAAENALIDKLRDEKFNLLIVARPSPDKEKFLARCCHASGVVGLAAGGYADILAGAKKRAPKIVQAAGMEWSWRLMQDPLKLWKRIGWANVKFASAVLWNKILGVPRRPFFAIPLLHVVAIVVLVGLAYGKSLNAPYHFDDPEYIMRNTAIRSFGTLNEITVTAHRKLWWLSNAICYKLSELYGNHTVEKPDPRVFRLWNIICHAIAALALYGMLRHALRARSRDAEPSLDMRPFAAAAIFAAHPLCTESVTYISGRDNGMGGMFYLLGLYFACIAFERLRFGTRASTPPVTAATLAIQWPRWFWPALLMLVMGACAVLTKESHLTFPAAVALVYVCFYRGPAPAINVGLLLGLFGAVAVIAWGSAGRFEGRLWIALPWAILALGAGAIAGTASGRGGRIKALFERRVKYGWAWAFLLVAAGLGIASLLAFPYSYSRTIGALTGYQGSSFVRSLCSQSYALPRMFLRAVFPLQITFEPFNLAHNLNIDHDFPTIADPHDPRVFWNAALLLALLLFGLIGAWRGWLGSFGVLLAFIVIAPTNTVIERGDIVSERNFYLVAAAGACVLAWAAAGIARWLFARAVQVSKSARIEAALWSVLLASCVAGPFAAFTVIRNYDWGDPLRLWNAALQASPNKMRVLYNYGVSAQVVGKYEEAESSFTRAIQIGEQLSQRGLFRPDEAVDLKCFHLSYARLADIHLQRFINSNREDQRPLGIIRTIYEKGLARTAWDPDLAFSYANFLVNTGQAASSLPVLRQSYELHPWADHLYMLLGIAYFESGDYPNAAAWFERAQTQKDEHALGMQFRMRDEDRARILIYLGITRARMGRDDAVPVLQEGLRLDATQVLTPILYFNAVRNLKLPLSNTADLFLRALSQTRRGIVLALRDAATNLVVSKTPTNPPNIENYRATFADEIERRDAHQKRREDAGFTDNPDKNDDEKK